MRRSSGRRPALAGEVGVRLHDLEALLPAAIGDGDALGVAGIADGDERIDGGVGHGDAPSGRLGVDKRLEGELDGGDRLRRRPAAAPPELEGGHDCGGAGRTDPAHLLQLVG
jgi:hypothetical protein